MLQGIVARILPIRVMYQTILSRDSEGFKSVLDRIQNDDNWLRQLIDYGKSNNTNIFDQILYTPAILSQILERSYAISYSEMATAYNINITLVPKDKYQYLNDIAQSRAIITLKLIDVLCKLYSGYDLTKIKRAKSLIFMYKITPESRVLTLNRFDWDNAIKSAIQSKNLPLLKALSNFYESDEKTKFIPYAIATKNANFVDELIEKNALYYPLLPMEYIFQALEKEVCNAVHTLMKCFRSEDDGIALYEKFNSMMFSNFVVKSGIQCDLEFNQIFSLLLAIKLKNDYKLAIINNSFYPGIKTDRYILSSPYFSDECIAHYIKHSFRKGRYFSSKVYTLIETDDICAISRMFQLKEIGTICPWSDLVEYIRMINQKGSEWEALKNLPIIQLVNNYSSGDFETFQETLSKTNNSDLIETKVHILKDSFASRKFDYFIATSKHISEKTKLVDSHEKYSFIDYVKIFFQNIPDDVKIELLLELLKYKCIIKNLSEYEKRNAMFTIFKHYQPEVLSHNIVKNKLLHDNSHLQAKLTLLEYCKTDNLTDLQTLFYSQHQQNFDRIDFRTMMDIAIENNSLACLAFILDNSCAQLKDDLVHLANKMVTLKNQSAIILLIKSKFKIKHYQYYPVIKILTSNAELSDVNDYILQSDSDGEELILAASEGDIHSVENILNQHRHGLNIYDEHYAIKCALDKGHFDIYYILLKHFNRAELVPNLSYSHYGSVYDNPLIWEDDILALTTLRYIAKLPISAEFFWENKVRSRFINSVSMNTVLETLLSSDEISHSFCHIVSQLKLAFEDSELVGQFIDKTQSLIDNPSLCKLIYYYFSVDHIYLKNSTLYGVPLRNFLIEDELNGSDFNIVEYKKLKTNFEKIKHLRDLSCVSHRDFIHLTISDNIKNLESSRTSHGDVDDKRDTARAHAHFNNRVKPYFQAQFQSWGESHDERILKIECKIRELILDYITFESDPSNEVLQFIKTNDKALIAGEPHILEASVPYFSGSSDPGYSAWRALNPFAPTEGYFTNLFIPQTGEPKTEYTITEANVGLEEVNTHTTSAQMRERLCYYYLSVTDLELSYDLIHNRIVNFICKIADIRNAHNLIDDVSCYPGHITRVSEMGRFHPVSELPVSDEERIENIMRSIIVSHFNETLHVLSTDLERERFFDAIMGLNLSSYPDYLNGKISYSEELWAMRRLFTKSLPDLDEVFYNYMFEKMDPTITDDDKLYFLRYYLDPTWGSIGNAISQCYKNFGERSATNDEISNANPFHLSLFIKERELFELLWSSILKTHSRISINQCSRMAEYLADRVKLILAQNICTIEFVQEIATQCCGNEEGRSVLSKILSQELVSNNIAIERENPYRAQIKTLENQINRTPSLATHFSSRIELIKLKASRFDELALAYPDRDRVRLQEDVENYDVRPVCSSSSITLLQVPCSLQDDPAIETRFKRLQPEPSSSPLEEDEYEPIDNKRQRTLISRRDRKREERSAQSASSGFHEPNENLKKMRR